MIALYDGVCDDCRTAIESGQEIEHTHALMGGSGWKHTDCAAAAAERRRSENPTCPECWLQHPVGACDA